MNDRDTKPTREELIALLSTPGWHLKTGADETSLKDRPLEELVRLAHERHRQGETHWTISRLKNAIELDLIELQQLWEHLGLPI